MHVGHADFRDATTLISERVLRIRHDNVDHRLVPGCRDAMEVIRPGLPRGRNKRRELDKVRDVIHGACLVSVCR